MLDVRQRLDERPRLLDEEIGLHVVYSALNLT